jgi:CRP/FNR family transcriptional regulator, cyclic AMP receptor protein
MGSHTTRKTFDSQAFLDSAGMARIVVAYRTAETIYSQGDVCETVMYLRKGEVRLSVRSRTGREAIVAVLGPGDFFGEGALADQPLRAGSATATAPSTILVIGKIEMLRVLHEQHALSDRFIAHVLARNWDVEEDLIDQLFSGGEERLARTLLLLAHYGEAGKLQRMIPKISQDTLAEMAGITRSRVNFFMTNFKKLGFIEYNGGLKINDSLVSVVLHD